ncbi:MAG: hydrogenase nickel incorporation protein HypB [Bacillota bacterium]
MVTVRLMERAMKNNDAVAAANARRLEEAGIFAVDLMSSPGSGKTTILERTLDALGDLQAAVIEGDVCTTRDAERIEAMGVPVVQINTGGACHLDAGAVRDALESMDLQGCDLLFIENVGNLICPAGFRLGETERVMVLSVTEGADKPEKYPAMFRSCSVALVNKIDLLQVLEMDLDRITDEIRRVNPAMKILPVSARTGEGMEEWYEWLEAKVMSGGGR